MRFSRYISRTAKKARRGEPEHTCHECKQSRAYFLTLDAFGIGVAKVESGKTLTEDDFKPTLCRVCAFDYCREDVVHRKRKVMYIFNARRRVQRIVERYVRRKKRKKRRKAQSSS